MGRCLVSELLELLLSAGSLGDLEHSQANSFSQGPALTNHDDITHLDVPDRGGQTGVWVCFYGTSASGCT